MLDALLLIAALQTGQATVGTAPDTLLPEPDSAHMATAYADAATRELVRLARGRRDVIDASVFHYTARSHQRISVGISALRRERLLFRRETASRIEWYRDRPSRIRIEGARQAVPAAMPGLQIPDELESWARGFLLEPGDDRLFATPEGRGFAWHPLVEGGEALYRYAIGDSTVIQLPNGTRIRLVELRAMPRQRDVRVVTGSFWIERENHAIVQALFRPASDFDLERDLAEIDPEEAEEEADDIDEVPAMLKPIRFDIDYVTVEYGLWEMRWWMPRLMAFRGSLQMGVATLPLSMEIRYSDYVVEPDRLGFPELPAVIRDLAGDTLIRPRPYTYPVVVEVADSSELLNSPRLLDSFYASGEALITEDELRDLSDRIGALPPSPWEVGRPRITPPWVPGRGLMRYNRVEALSVGVRADWDLGRARLDLTPRLATAGLQPTAELGAATAGFRRRWRLAAYHRLAVADPSLRPLGLGNSLTAFLFGRDDGTYFRAMGAELRVVPAGAGVYSVRVYGERQRAAPVHTDVSVPHLIDPTVTFRPNIDAAPADQLGLAVRVGKEWGLNPEGARWGGWLDVSAETGTYTFARPGLTTRLAVPVLGVLTAVELGAGTTFEAGGSAPIQASWFLGGPATLRGFPGGSMAGPDYARARLEAANRFPAARVALFTDAGWAGRFTEFRDRDAAVSVGLGASFFDGLLRVDLARALHPDPAFRLELYIDAIL